MRAYSYLYQSSRLLPFTSDLSKTASYVPAIPHSDLGIESAGSTFNAAALQRLGDYCQYHRR